jgi:hypothetical protein
MALTALLGTPAALGVDCELISPIARPRLVWHTLIHNVQFKSITSRLVQEGCFARPVLYPWRKAIEHDHIYAFSKDGFVLSFLMF